VQFNECHERMIEGSLRSHGAPPAFGVRTAFVLALLIAVCLLPGCSAKKQVPQTDPSAVSGSALDDVTVAAPDHAELYAELYAELEMARLEYEDGIELVEAGDEIMGEELIATATNRILAGAEECARADGCELDRFFETFELLLASQTIALKKQASRIESLETTIKIEEEVGREPGTSPFVATMPEIGETVSLLRGTDLREVIELNGPVKAALDDWLTWMRPMLMSAYENYQFLREDIAPIYEEAGLPEALLFAMLAAETGGKVHSYSRAGAVGLLQFMRRTGRLYGLTTVDGFDMRLDPAAATRANVAYLNDRFAELNDNLEKALAAYNGGEARMRGLQRRLGGASFWDSELYYSLPRETREYVPRILAAAWLFLHAEDYNLEFPPYETDKTDLVIQQDIAIGELTICLGQKHNPAGWFRTLRNLNPRLEPGERIEAGESIRVPSILVPIYEENCLEGEIVERARELHDANYPDEPELIIHTVRRGDTLGRIASRHRCASIQEIAAINKVRPPRYVIHVGQRLKIPSCP
jgi:membrane-bound lytic murein transglycosylase D